MTTPIPLVIDTDIGGDVDDALAIMLALASPEVDLIGVTVVDRDVDLRARIAARLLGMAGRPDIPVFRGLTQLLSPGRPSEMDGTAGIGLLDLPYDGPEATIHDTPAPDWLIEESRRRTFHLAAVGPFSNVAAAIQRDPGVAGRLRHLSVMGGMVHPDHFSTAWRRYFARAERHPASIDYNTATDPTAALIVARAGIPMTWVTAEITFQAPFTIAGLAEIERVGSPLSTALGAMARIWSERWFHQLQALPDDPSPVPEDAVACFHDPLAVASIFAGDWDWDWLTLQPHRLRYDVANHLFHVHNAEDDNVDAVADVSVAVAGPAFERFYLDRVVAFLRHVTTP